MSLFFRLLRRRNELPPAGDRAPSGPIPGCWPPRCSEAEVDIAGRVPAAALAALAHPSARQAELGSAESDARDVSAEAELIGATTISADSAVDFLRIIGPPTPEPRLRCFESRR